jgi:hypothetical protein
MVVPTMIIDAGRLIVVSYIAIERTATANNNVANPESNVVRAIQNSIRYVDDVTSRPNGDCHDNDDDGDNACQDPSVNL